MPTGVYLLNGPWMQMNMASSLMGNENHGCRLVTFSILVHPNTRISATCNVRCVSGEWRTGTVEIWLLDAEGKRRDDKRWKFDCRFNENGDGGWNIRWLDPIKSQ
ncbi:MAG: hypothetical protein WC242_00290 [Candidatus Paceibacterota bacterium]